MLRMPKLRREIFLAIRFDGASYAEIAERTGLSVKQVERHFARSMATLLDAFERRPPTPRCTRFLRRIAKGRRR